MFYGEYRLTLVGSHCSGRPTAVGRAVRPLAAPWGGRSSYSHCSGAGAAGAVFSYTLAHNSTSLRGTADILASYTRKWVAEFLAAEDLFK